VEVDDEAEVVEEIHALHELAFVVVADELDTYAAVDVVLHNLYKLDFVNVEVAFLLEKWYMDLNWVGNFVGASYEGTRVPPDRSGNHNYSTFHFSLLIDVLQKVACLL